MLRNSSLVCSVAMKLFPCMLSVGWYRFLECSVCDKIVSLYAQHKHAIILKKYSKIPNQKAILTINNQNFKKQSRNPSYRKKIFDSSSKNLGSAYDQPPRKCSNIKILAKIEGNKSKLFLKIDQGHIRF
jgi:hypothetical protein